MGGGGGAGVMFGSVWPADEQPMERTKQLLALVHAVAQKRIAVRTERQARGRGSQLGSLLLGCLCDITRYKASVSCRHSKSSSRV